MEPNRELRAAREARPSVRVPGTPLGRPELAELVAAEVYRQTGREVPVDAHYVAKLERGVIRWPSASYRTALAAVLGVDEATLGFRSPHCPAPVVPEPYRTDDGLLALAARAEVTSTSRTSGRSAVGPTGRSWTPTPIPARHEEAEEPQKKRSTTRTTG